MPSPPQRKLRYGPQGEPVKAPLSVPEYPLTEAGGPVGLVWPVRPMEPYYADPMWWQKDLDDLLADDPADPDLLPRHLKVPGL